MNELGMFKQKEFFLNSKNYLKYLNYYHLGVALPCVVSNSKTKISK